jgi:hypothetical protein
MRGDKRGLKKAQKRALREWADNHDKKADKKADKNAPKARTPKAAKGRTYAELSDAERRNIGEIYATYRRTKGANGMSVLAIERDASFDLRERHGMNAYECWLWLKKAEKGKR